ncbi:hypothetical protein AB4093_05210 [Inquilinus sp. 2KB_12]|uniref:hypothetical protein n=1 Tax=Inquilinus sp. 2KB_12 TaxID=3232975 RepID=UPI003F8E542C
MDNAPTDAAPDETQPVDPDREWTVWALGKLRELVDIGMRTARRIETQQMATPIVPPPPDFALMQARVARAVRLSIAMTERIREAYRARKAEAETAAAAVQARRQRRRAQVARAVAEALGPERPAGAAGAKDAGSPAAPRESLTETEVPDVELDTLPIDEIVLRICRRLGRTPGRLPQRWEDAFAEDEAAGPLDEPLPEALTDPPPEAPEPAAGRGGTGRPARKPPDSS